MYTTIDHRRGTVTFHAETVVGHIQTTGIDMSCNTERLRREWESNILRGVRNPLTVARWHKTDDGYIVPTEGA